MLPICLCYMVSLLDWLLGMSFVQLNRQHLLALLAGDVGLF